MNLVVLGASGGCGQQLVKKALERGHTVTAVVRSSSTFDAPAGVRVERGDLTSADFLASVLPNHDAVLSALGLRLPGLAPWSTPEDPTFLTRSTPALVEAMKRSGIKRVFAISAGGVGDSYAAMPGFFKAFISFTALKKAYRELEELEKVLRASGLEVCFPRPSGLTDGPATGNVVVTRTFAGRATISRADVAGWMVEQVERPTFLGQAPMITVTGAASK